MHSSRVQVLTSLYSLVIFLAVSAVAPASVAKSLKVGFYRKSCPSAEATVRRVVSKHLCKNPGLGAGLLRMHFHDCFVRGCDASVLLDSTPGSRSEKDHPANNPSLRGFEVIDEAKAMIERECPGTVSCADILAFAARDSTYELGGVYYSIPGGRRDGRVSREDEVPQNLPSFKFNAQQLQANFARKGLSVVEMVTLSGAHSIGVAHCSSFSGRLYSLNATHSQDPSVDPSFAAFLRTKCPPPTQKGNNPTLPLDFGTPNRLDNHYYMNLKHHRGLLNSDQTLYTSPLTSKLVKKNAKNGLKWGKKFAKAMRHVGSIDVLTGNEGEIRKTCRAVNY